eukprot:199838-Amphidinium_carterae.1
MHQCHWQCQASLAKANSHAKRARPIGPCQRRPAGFMSAKQGQGSAGEGMQQFLHSCFGTKICTTTTAPKVPQNIFFPAHDMLGCSTNSSWKHQ